MKKSPLRVDFEWKSITATEFSMKWSIFIGTMATYVDRVDLTAIAFLATDLRVKPGFL